MSTSALTPTVHAEPHHPYVGLTVVEFETDIAGEFAAKLLAEMGADVIKVEPPGGSPTRSCGPFVNDHDDVDHSLTFWYYNRNKRSVVIDRTTPEGASALAALLADADLLVTTANRDMLTELGVGPDGVHEENPALVTVAVTPFGLDGPWADYRSSDLVALAAGGPLNCCGYDDLTIPPIRPGGNQGYHTAASFAHIGLLLALIERQRTGRGQLVDVSMHESLAVTVELANPYWMYSKTLVRRQTCRHAQPVLTQPALFRATDGYLYFVLITTDNKSWAQLVSWLDSKGLAADLVDEAYRDPAYRQQQFGHIQSVVEVFFLVHDAETLYREGQDHGLAIGILYAPEDLHEDRHLREREFFVDVDHDEVGQIAYPGLPYRFSALTPAEPRRAPKLGEHTSQVLGEYASSS